MVDQQQPTKLVLGALLVILLVLAGMWVVRARSQAALLETAFEKFIAAPTYHTHASLFVRLPEKLRDRERPLQNITFALHGDVAEGEQGPEFIGNFTITARGRGTVLFAEGDAVMLHDAVTFKLDQLPTLLNPTGNLLHKWTYVKAPVWTVGNLTDVTTTLRSALPALTPVGSEEVDGRRARKFVGQVSEEAETALMEVFRRSTSGSQALHVLARLLQAYRVSEVTVWVDEGTQELSQIRLSFFDEKKQQENAALLTLSFTEYNKEVVLSRPPVELQVNPQVFGKLFGQGEVTPITNE